jgi:hypothetical protein
MGSGWRGHCAAETSCTSAPPASRPPTLEGPIPAMTSSSEAASRLSEIDALQDEVLQQLAELERRCEEVLATCQVAPVAKATVPFPQSVTGMPKPAKRKAA